MTLTHQLTKRLFDKEQTELGKHARDTQSIFDKIPVQQHRTIDALYAEPMTLGALTEEPFSIELVRLINLYAPEQPVTASFGFVHFVWRPNNGGAQITKVGGMSVASNGTTKYRFYYRITFKME